MAIELVSKTKKSGTNMFIQIAIVLLGVIGGYVFFSNYIEPNRKVLVMPDIPRNDTLSRFRNVKEFNFDILNDAAFKSLQIFGSIPVQPGPTGKDNVFNP